MKFCDVLFCRPIIQEATAKQLGMDVSLLEKYSTDMQMLDTQYRMVCYQYFTFLFFFLFKYLYQHEACRVADYIVRILRYLDSKVNNTNQYQSKWSICEFIRKIMEHTMYAHHSATYSISASVNMCIPVESILRQQTKDS